MVDQENPIINSEPNNPKLELSSRKFYASASIHSGPLPSPEILAGYERILPGAAERILSMAEAQAKHRQSMETIIVKSGSRDSLIGEIFALIIGLVAIIAGAYVSIKGQPWSGTVIGTAGLATLVGTFIYGSRGIQQEKEEPQRTQELQTPESE